MCQTHKRAALLTSGIPTLHQAHLLVKKCSARHRNLKRTRWTIKSSVLELTANSQEMVSASLAKALPGFRHR